MNQPILRHICLKTYPKNLPRPGDFIIESQKLPEPKCGEISVINRYLSLDPYMRGRMTPMDSYAAYYQLGQPLSGGAVGEVLQSNHPGFKKGDWVSSLYGWREGFTAKVEHSPLLGMEKLDVSAFAPEDYLSIAGMTGLTAYIGLKHIGKVKPAETVLISGASGAVGSAAVQFAAHMGARIIALTSDDRKAKWLESLGAFKAINYKALISDPAKCPGKTVDAKLSKALTPAILGLTDDGIDIYFDMIGAQFLETALDCLKKHGRVISCGMMENYSGKECIHAPDNLTQIFKKSLKIQGFIIYDYENYMSEYRAFLKPLTQANQFHRPYTYIDGLDNMAEGFIELLTGKKTGKMIVRL